MIELFTVTRQEDESGTSGKGHVLSGIIFESGKVACCWQGAKGSIVIFDNWKNFMDIHIGQHPTNRSIIKKVHIDTTNGDIDLTNLSVDTKYPHGKRKDILRCGVCYGEIIATMNQYLMKEDFIHRTKSKGNFPQHRSRLYKGEGSERQEGESDNDCVSRKISILSDEHPKWKHDQVVAVAHEMCGVSRKTETEKVQKSPKNIQIEIANHSDAEIIQKIQAKTMPEPLELSMWKVYINDIGNNHPYHNIIGYVAKREEHVIGYIHGFYHRDKRRGYISSIAVEPDFQKQGIGQLLLDEFMKWLIKFKPESCSLHMRHHNNKAFRFYQENGFVVTGQLHNAVYMTKEFKPDSREEDEEEDEEEKSEGVTNTSDATMTTDTSGVMNPAYSGKKPAEIK